MKPGTAIVQRGQAETAAFTQALRDIDARGLSTPCSNPEIAHWWLSEDALERRKAVKWCRGCSVLIECGKAAAARQERWFVWGGIDRSRNPKGPSAIRGTSSGSTPFWLLPTVEPLRASYLG
jgi:hypothetical protein